MNLLMKVKARQESELDKLKNETNELLRVCNKISKDYAEVVMNMTERFEVVKDEESLLTVSEVNQWKFCGK